MPEGSRASGPTRGRLYEAFGWTVHAHRRSRADDLLGAFARLEGEAGGDTLLFTGDRDMFQASSDKVTVCFPAAAPRRTGRRRSAPPRSARRYGIEPSRSPTHRLRGDPSDGLPGAGHRRQDRPDLLAAHGTLEGVFEAAAKPAR